MCEFKVDNKVVANRDLPGRGILKGDHGVVTKVTCIDSDTYLFIKMDSGDTIGPSCDNSWDLEE